MERAPDRGHHSANIHRQLFLRSPFDPPARQSKALSRHELKGAEAHQLELLLGIEVDRL
jgi:hypothetical protein